jgi:YYY domain-containing protein
MGELLAWWLAIELVGIAALPLSAVLFARLPDRGWALAKPLGLLAVGWLIWFPLSIVTALPYSRGWIVGTLVVFALGNLALLLRVAEVRASLLHVLTRERVYVVLAEVVFAGAFALMAWVRAFTPAVVDQEKFMDAAFLSAIWRAPHLPPPDPWLAGEPINYYYFGHYLLATLAKLLDTPPAVAFNVGIALVFALTALAVFAVAANLLALIRRPAVRWDGEAGPLARSSVAGVFSALLVLVLGNFYGAQVAWQQAVSLSNGPGAPLTTLWAYFFRRDLWTGYDWWGPSRVIPNTINEFPAFSFVLADLHAHVLALPFAALAVGVALGLLLRDGEGLRAFGSRVTGPLTILTAGIALGALYAINGWDLPTYLGLALLALTIQQWLAHGRRLDSVLLLDLFSAGAVLVALAVLLYLPFYRGFISPSQGVGLVPGGARSPVGLELAIWALPLALVASYLVWQLALWLGERLEGVEASDPGWSFGKNGWTGTLTSPRVLGGLIVGLATVVLVLLTLATAGFLGWTLLWVTAIVGACAALALRLLGVWQPRVMGALDALDAGKGAVAEEPGVDKGETSLAPTMANQDVSGTSEGSSLWGGALAADTLSVRAEAWLLVMIGTAAALVAACELVFLRDVFAGGSGQLGDLFRMNTVFKLYYQAWLLAGIAGGPLLVLLLRAALRTFARTFALVLEFVSIRVSGARTSGTASMAATTTRTNASVEAESPAVAAASRVGEPAEAASAVSEAPGGPANPSGQAAAEQHASVANGESAWMDARFSQAHHRVGALRYAGAGGIVIWMAMLVLLVAAALVYPVMASAARTVNFTLPRTLDGTAFMRSDPMDAGDADAIAWLNRHVQGDQVIVEAAKYDEYTHLGRVSAFTGLPTLLGWGGHELQWRVNWLAEPGRGDVIATRLDAVTQIYTNPDETTVKQLLHRYSVRLIYVGAAERQTYPTANLDRFAGFLPIVYQREGVTIYGAPEGSSR